MSDAIKSAELDQVMLRQALGSSIPSDWPAALLVVDRPVKLLFLSLFLASLTVGCGRSPSEASNGQEPLATLASLYGRRQAMHGGRGPRDEASFKEFIGGPGKGLMERRGHANVETLFVSPRDGQPFVVLYDDKKQSPPTAVCIYEAQGIGGKRLAAASNGNVREMDANELSQILGNPVN